MIKLVGLFKRKPEMTREEFVNRYETVHAPLAAELLPFISAYSRSFVRASEMPAHIVGWTPKFSFDVITEVWYESMQVFKDQSATLAGDTGARIGADEQLQFLREEQLLFLAEEKVTPPALLAPRPSGATGRPPIKIVGMLSRRPGMSRAEFIDYYEQNHARLACEHIRKDGRPLFAAYSRTFPTPNGVMRHDYMNAPPMPMEFDVITQMWFWNEEDHRAFGELLADPQVGALFTADEEKLFDRSRMYGFAVDEYVTAPEKLARATPATP